MKFRIENKDIIFGKDKSVKALCNKAKKLTYHGIVEDAHWYLRLPASPQSLQSLRNIYFDYFSDVLTPEDRYNFDKIILTELKRLQANRAIVLINPSLSRINILRNKVMLEPVIGFPTAVKVKSLSKQINFYEKLLRQQVSLALRNYIYKYKLPITLTQSTFEDKVEKIISTQYNMVMEDIRINYRKLNNLILKVESIEKDIKSEIDLISKIDLKTLVS